MAKLEEQIKAVIKRNLLWIEENLLENVTVSRRELGCEIELLSSLESYTDEFLSEIMKVLKENILSEMEACKLYCLLFKE